MVILYIYRAVIGKYLGCRALGREFDHTSRARLIQNSTHSPERVPGPIQHFSAKQWPKTVSFPFICKYTASRYLHIYMYLAVICQCVSSRLHESHMRIIAVQSNHALELTCPRKCFVHFVSYIVFLSSLNNNKNRIPLQYDMLLLHDDSVH